MERTWLLFGGLEVWICGLLYHPRRPCANPAGRIMMNKSKSIGVNMVAAETWLTD
jgi:hypothetical protein